MVDEHGVDEQGGVDEHERQRRKRAAALLGDILPATARDDRAEGWNESDADAERSRDDELRRDVPPHH